MKSGVTYENQGSAILTPVENDEVFRLIGNRCQCLAAGVVQLFLTEAPSHNEWMKKNTGVMTLIRDNLRRSYFFRLYCPFRKAMMWEHEVYNTMDYKSPTPYFHTFEGEDCMVSFNFASERDACFFRESLLKKLNAKRQKKQERRSKLDMETPHGATMPRTSEGMSSKEAFGSTTGLASNLINGTPMNVGVNRSASSSSMYKSQKKKRKKDPKRRLTKADIGLPSNFRHVFHFGLNSENEIEPEVRQVLVEAGVTDKQLQHKKTREFIYEFIGKYNASNEASNGGGSGAGNALPPRNDVPPPVPARTIPFNSSPSINSYHGKAPPPLPPSHSSAAPPPPPPSAPPVHHKILPSRPPPPSGMSPAPPPAVPPPMAAPPPVAPPPPPPPPPTRDIGGSGGGANSGAPPPPPLPAVSDTDSSRVANHSHPSSNHVEAPDPRHMLMESIRSGTTLRKVDKSEIKPTSPADGGTDARSNLLEEIRKGIELKPVPNEPKAAAPPVLKDGLAGALSRALAERSRAWYSDSEDSTSDTSDDDDVWED